MGQYFIYVNPNKRQYVDPGEYGMNNKSGDLGQGVPGFAVALLICDAFDPGPTGLVGSWVGDPVVAAGDENGKPDPGGTPTATITHPERNLYATARQEFADITGDSIAMVVNFSDRATEELAHFALDGIAEGLVEIGAVAFRPDCVALRRALERIDPHWTVKYKKRRDTR
jgi:hypothetical protein